MTTRRPLPPGFECLAAENMMPAELLDEIKRQRNDEDAKQFTAPLETEIKRLGEMKKAKPIRFKFGRQEFTAPAKFNTSQGVVTITADGNVILPREAECTLTTWDEKPTSQPKDMCVFTTKEVKMFPGTGLVIRIHQAAPKEQIGIGWWYTC